MLLSNIPPELIENITQYLPLSDLYNVKEIDENWNAESLRESHAQIWKTLVLYDDERFFHLFDNFHRSAITFHGVGSWLNGLFVGTERHLLFNVMIYAFECREFDDFAWLLIPNLLHGMELNQHEVYRVLKSPTLNNDPTKSSRLFVNLASNFDLNIARGIAKKMDTPELTSWELIWNLRTTHEARYPPQIQSEDVEAAIRLEEMRWRLDDGETLIPAMSMLQAVPTLLLSWTDDTRDPDEMGMLFERVEDRDKIATAVRVVETVSQGNGALAAKCLLQLFIPEFLRMEWNQWGMEILRALLASQTSQGNPTFLPKVVQALSKLNPQVMLTLAPTYMILLSSTHRRPLLDPRLPEHVSRFVSHIKLPLISYRVLWHTYHKLMNAEQLNDVDGRLVMIMRVMLTQLNLVDPFTLSQLIYVDKTGILSWNVWAKVLPHVFNTGPTDTVFSPKWKELFGHLFKKQITEPVTPFLGDFIIACFPYTSVVDAFGLARDLQNFIQVDQLSHMDLWKHSCSIVAPFVHRRLHSPRNTTTNRDIARLLMDEFDVDNKKDAMLLVAADLQVPQRGKVDIAGVQKELDALFRAKQAQQAKLTMSIKMIAEEDELVSSVAKVALNNRTNRMTPSRHKAWSLEDTSMESDQDSPDKSFGRPKRLFSSESEINVENSFDRIMKDASPEKIVAKRMYQDSRETSPEKPRKPRRSSRLSQSAKVSPVTKPSPLSPNPLVSAKIRTIFMESDDE